MRLSLRKAITLILFILLLFSLFSFSSSTFAVNNKVSAELTSKISKFSLKTN